MARLKKKTELIEYIKVQLGSPTIQIEVTDAQMSNIIDDAIQKFTEYAYGTLEGAVVVEFAGINDYAMPDLITNIIKLSKGTRASGMSFSKNYGDGLVPDLWSQSKFSTSSGGVSIDSIIQVQSTQAIFDKYFGDDINHNFNYNKRILQLLENYHGKALLHYNYEYVADDENDNIFNHEWIKAYSIAKVKTLWGHVTGKYDQALVGGAKINYDRLISEGLSEIEKLDEDLLNRWSDPAPIDIA